MAHETEDDPDVQREHQDATVDQEISPDPRPRRKSLTWALAEIGIVTVGILIAFSLEAWWDDRAMARQEQIHLRALASDLQQNIDALDRLIELEESVVSSSHKMLMKAQGRDSNVEESLDELMSGVYNSARYEPIMGAYEALVNSAGLTIIQDDALRASLADFAAQVSDRYAESWSDEHYFSFSREFGGRVVLGIHQVQTEVQSAVDHERELEALLREPRFRGHLAMRYFNEREMARKYRELQQQAESVLAQVRARIRE